MNQLIFVTLGDMTDADKVMK